MNAHLGLARSIFCSSLVLCTARMRFLAMESHSVTRWQSIQALRLERKACKMSGKGILAGRAGLRCLLGFARLRFVRWLCRCFRGGFAGRDHRLQKCRLMSVLHWPWVFVLARWFDYALARWYLRKIIFIDFAAIFFFSFRWTFGFFFALYLACFSLETLDLFFEY